ncbi:MAG: hypothetical protein KME03_17915 [Aphanocapsa lilacina HA4352-LM1]|nr:hypothetical protein [Aphanocapsa lilacina HA4352-LM1]
MALELCWHSPTFTEIFTMDKLANSSITFASRSLVMLSLVFGNASALLAQEAIPLEKAAQQLNTTEADAAKYWTPAKIQGAKPFAPPKRTQTGPVDQNASETPPQTGEAPVSVDGQPPTKAVNPKSGVRLFTPTSKETASTEQAKPVPQDVGTGGAYFTSSQLVPSFADAYYPYSTVGKFFFTIPITIPNAGDYVCSAAVLRPRVILTAGHCIHSGNGAVSGYYQNFLFVPAYNYGYAPYGLWNWAYANTTGSWFYGDGGVPNAGDFAMLEAADNSSYGTSTLGSITGWLGYLTLSLVPNHATMLGYPVGFDSGLLMHQVNAGSYQYVSPNSGEYGSDMTGGSSGGPWIQNFGYSSSGQTGGLLSGRNQVIGVTSYGYTDPAILRQGSSIPDSGFLNLLDNVCSHRPGNC